MRGFFVAAALAVIGGVGPAGRAEAQVIGTGGTGMDFARKIRAHRDFGYNLVGFLDDDETKQGSNVLDLPVLGGCVMLPELLADSGIPPGVINLVSGDGPNAGAPLVEHPLVNMISFTGSTAVGTHIGEIGGRLNKRISLEMGGKNPIIIMDDADLDLAVEGVLWGAFGTSGQRCTATSRLLVQEGVYDKFLDMLVARATALKIGDGLDESVEVGPIINAEAQAKILEYIEIGKAEGAKLKCGGNRLDRGDYVGARHGAPVANLRRADFPGGLGQRGGGWDSMRKRRSISSARRAVVAKSRARISRRPARRTRRAKWYDGGVA